MKIYQDSAVDRQVELLVKLVKNPKLEHEIKAALISALCLQNKTHTHTHTHTQQDSFLNY